MGTEARSVLITGASSGIGAAAATELARRGHRVFATARRTARLADLAGRDARITPLALDVTDPDSVAAAVAEIRRTHPAGVDVLINNAGFALAGPVETVSAEASLRQFETNVFGLLHVTRAVLPGMRARGSGRIVNISSVLGRLTLPASGLYSASKHAVEALSAALRAELRPFGVDVVVVAPGFIRTELADHLGPADAAREDPYRALVAGSARFLRRRVAAGADPARLARLLADVAEARRARTRYPFPASGRLLTGLTALTPARLVDRAVLRSVTAG